MINAFMDVLLAMSGDQGFLRNKKFMKSRAFMRDFLNAASSLGNMTAQLLLSSLALDQGDMKGSGKELWN